MALYNFKNYWLFSVDDQSNNSGNSYLLSETF